MHAALVKLTCDFESEHVSTKQLGNSIWPQKLLAAASTSGVGPERKRQLSECLLVACHNWVHARDRLTNTCGLSLAKAKTSTATQSLQPEPNCMKSHKARISVGVVD